MKFLRILVFFLLLITNDAMAQETVHLRADYWAPYNGEPASEHPGFLIDIARAVFEPYHIEIDYEVTPWSRAVREVERGAADGVVGTDKLNTPKFVFPDEEQGMFSNAFMLRSDSSWVYEGLSSLDKVHVAVVNNYVFGKDRWGGDIDAYLAQYAGKNVEILNGEHPIETAVELLSKRRIDTYLDSPEVFFAAVSKMKLDPASFKKGVQLGPSIPVYIAFSPAKDSSRRYAAILSEGMRRLRASGELSKILSVYGLKDWK
jgi:polar amino acid transport system substrate-binding protein